MDVYFEQLAYEIHRRLGQVRKPKIKSTLKSGVLADPNDKERNILFTN